MMGVRPTELWVGSTIFGTLVATVRVGSIGGASGPTIFSTGCERHCGRASAEFAAEILEMSRQLGVPKKTNFRFGACQACGCIGTVNHSVPSRQK